MSETPSTLFILNSLSTGGSEAKVIKLANALALSGLPVDLAYLNPPETLLGRIDRSVSVFNLERRGKYSFKTLHQLRRIMQREHAAVVAVNLYPLLYMLPAIRWRKGGNAKAFGLVNTAFLVGKEKRAGRLYGFLLKKCDRVIFGCRSQRTGWVKKYGLSSQRADVIYNGVDCEHFSPTGHSGAGKALLAQHKVPDGAFVIGSIGRLAPEKSFDLLVMAVASLNASGRAAFLVLAGEGDEHAKLQQLARAQGVSDRVVFLGLQSDVRPALSVMDIFALPSTAVETFSNAALEAMAMARPVVLSDMGGAAEMVEHGVSGMVVPTGDLDALTAALSDLYDSGELRRRLAAAARERVTTTFSFEKMVENYKQRLHDPAFPGGANGSGD